jgi:hypothetical protein
MSTKCTYPTRVGGVPLVLNSCVSHFLYIYYLLFAASKKATTTDKSIPQHLEDTEVPYLKVTSRKNNYLCIIIALLDLVRIINLSRGRSNLGEPT